VNQEWLSTTPACPGASKRSTPENGWQTLVAAFLAGM